MTGTPNTDNGQDAIDRNFNKAAYQSYRFVETMLVLMASDDKFPFVG